MDKLEQLVADRLSKAMGGAHVTAKQDRKTHKWTLRLPNAELRMSTQALDAHLLFVEALGTACGQGLTQESAAEAKRLRKAEGGENATR